MRISGFKVNSTNGSLMSDIHNLNYEAGEVYLLNQSVQVSFISLIILFAVMSNLAIIHNVSGNQLKMKSVNFLLIKNLCIADLIGAVLVLPVPLMATAKGIWDFGKTLCSLNCVVNVTIWFQHIVLFAMLKIDRVLASCLPIGKYPLFPVKIINGLVVLSWTISFSTAGLVTLLFHSSYEPAVVLCIPELPIEFFIAIFTIYCFVLFAMVTGYIGVLFYLKRKQKEGDASTSSAVLDYSGLEKAALMSFLITISHFLLYVPTILVIGLHGWFLHPIAILVCDMIVYSEFLIHPTVLLITSTKLREEIFRTLRKSIGKFFSLAVDFFFHRRRYCCFLTCLEKKPKKKMGFSGQRDTESNEFVGQEPNYVNKKSSVLSSVYSIKLPGISPLKSSQYWLSSFPDISHRKLSFDKYTSSLSYSNSFDQDNKKRRHSFHSIELKSVLKDMRQNSSQTSSVLTNFTEFS